MTEESNASFKQGVNTRGSLLIGFLLGWAVLIVANAAVFGLLAVLDTLGSNSSAGVIGPLLLGLPWIGQLALIVFFAIRNQPRSAVGVALAIVSLIALALLLVAACFGLFALNGGRWN